MEYLIIVIVALLAFGMFRFFRQKNFLKTLTEEQFREGYRKAQLIDVREPNEFKKRPYTWRAEYSADTAKTEACGIAQG